VRVVEVDEARKRISLTMKLEDKPEQRAPREPREPRQGQPRQGQPRQGGQGGGQPRQQGGQPRQQGGQSRQQGGQSRQQGGQSRQGSGPGGGFGNDAMADALRRAGLTKD